MKQIKADLHNHLATFIYKGSFNDVIDIAYKRLGSNGIFSITNGYDNRYEDFLNLKTSYKKESIGNSIYIPNKKILIIKGQEVFTKQGHLLVLGLSKNINLKHNKNLEDSLKQAKDNNTIVISPHPFFIGGLGNYLIKNHRHLKYFHGIEIHNGEAFYGNEKAKDFYSLIKEDYNLGALSFSDGHSVKEIGSSYTLLEKPNLKTFEKLIESLKKSVQQHNKDFSKDKQSHSIRGALKHSIAWGLMGYLSKKLNN